jgi:hypothetical protein
MDWKDYVIIGGALFLLFGGGVAIHFSQKGRGNVNATAGGAAIIDDVRRLGVSIVTVGGKAMAEGGKLAREGAMRYANGTEANQLNMVGGA